MASSQSDENKSFAVFLSYNGDDRETVEKLAVHLDDRAGLRPWFDQWSLVPGESWVRNLERGLEASLSCAVFVGQNGEGPWQRPEVEAALRFQVKREGFRVIPVLLPDAAGQPDLPVFLSGNTWVDFRRRGLEDDDALWRLECGVRGVPPGRGRPRGKPAASAGPTVAPPAVTPAVVEVAKARQPTSVFISYRHQEPDQTIAHALADALGQAGHKVFIDTGIRWGADWVKEINRHLEAARYFVLLLSKESAASEMVVEELALARELARKSGAPVILPVRVGLPFDEPLPYHVSVHLRSTQQEQWNRPDDTARLINQLLSVFVEEAGRADAATGEAPAAGGVSSDVPQPQLDPRAMIVPGGALDTSSRFYVMRQADEEVWDQVRRDRGVVTVRGPRQTGKTSLMMGTFAALRLGGGEPRAVFIDFQALSYKDLETLDAVWRAIADHVAHQLRLPGWDETCWKAGADHDVNSSRFLERCVFREDETPVLICLDEIDRVFKSPVKGDFFGTVRSFHNSGAYDAHWRKVRWLLGTSSEPSFFIEDLTQSPFNIGLRIDLDAFTPEEVNVLASRHGLTLGAETLARTMDYVGGRPYLVHLLFYQMVRRRAGGASAPGWQDGWRKLFDARTAGDGVFRDHLHRFLFHFQREAALAAAMKRVIGGEGCDDVRMASRLEAGGLVRRDKNMKVVPQCGLYADFFGQELR